MTNTEWIVARESLLQPGRRVQIWLTSHNKGRVGYVGPLGVPRSHHQLVKPPVALRRLLVQDVDGKFE
eukprot:scaffold27956_cov42-Prasinocladus_malaysianus.AAC.1